ncbi:MAG: SpoIIE family protein phosphatase [Holophagales bacterium]|nr:SpoIIE family protein phosphatase [Holophagales bacterium]
MPKPARVLLALVALVGSIATGIAMERWAPESHTRLPDPSAARARAAADAQALGYRVLGEPWIGVSNGHRQYHAGIDVGALAESVRDPELRHRLLERVPPVRLGIRHWRAESPNGLEGALFLEYDGEGRLIGGTFGMDGVLGAGLASESDRFAGDRLARILLGAEPPEPRAWSSASLEERLYQIDEQGPAAYVALTQRGAWLATLVPAPYRVVHRQAVAPWTRPPVEQVIFYVMLVSALAALCLLLWRLGERRAGLGHALPILALLVATALPAIGYFRSRPSVLVAISLFYLIPQLGLFLAWAVAEAEVRDVRPRSAEHWDRFIRWKPVRRTGGQILVGLAVGLGLAGLLSCGGRLAEVAGQGGYSRLLLVLPDYWMMSTPIHLGFVLATGTAFLVGLGGRLGGRAGAMVGSAVSACAWAYAIPVTPFGWKLGLASVAAMTAGWLLWHHGLLALVVACITAVSLPTAWFAWGVPEHMAPTAVLASTPALLGLLALVWRIRAPEQAEARTIVPSYVAGLEREARLEAEVHLLRDFQMALLPPDRPSAGGLDMAWRMLPADLVGGDFLDLVQDGSGRIWMAVADVAGHGISCSVLTAYTKAAVAEHAVAGRGPAEALTRIRRLFGRLDARRTMVTLLLAVWDPSTGRLTVATAGHPHLLVCRDGEVREAGISGPPLGSGLPITDRDEIWDCPPGTVLVAYTDGVVEARAPAGAQFGYDDWPGRLPALARLPAPMILERLLRALDQHCAGQPKDDDVTVLVSKIQGPAKSESR